MIKDLIARGIGFSPGSVKFIPTLGLSPGSAQAIEPYDLYYFGRGRTHDHIAKRKRIRRGKRG